MGEVPGGMEVPGGINLGGNVCSGDCFILAEALFKLSLQVSSSAIPSSILFICF